MTQPYKAPVALRVFHYVLWASLLAVLVWFVALPMVSNLMAPEGNGSSVPSTEHQ
jgi:hypothetical protein